MAVEADRVVVALIGDTSNLDRNVGQSARQFDRGMSSIERSATKAERAIVASSGNIGLAQRNMGRQIADIGTQLASGQSPFLILAQQAPQVADALADTSGRAGRLAAFFAGPWGAALLGAASIVGVLIGKLFDLEGAHKAAEKSADSHAEAERILDGVLQGTVNTSERARIAAIQLAQAHMYSARESLNEAKSQLALAKARAAAAAATERAAPGAVQIPGRGAASTAAQVQNLENLLQRREIALNGEEIRFNNLIRAAGLARGIEAKRDQDKTGKSAAAAQRRAEAAARREAREAERNSDLQRQGMVDLLRGRAELLAAEAELTSDSRIMDEALRQRIESERQISRAEIMDQEGLSAAQRDELLAINDRIAAARLRKVNIDEAQRYLEEEAKLLQAGLTNQRDVAAAQLDLAETTAERREISLRLLDIAIRQERADLDAVLASQQATEAQKQIARKRLASLDTLAGLQRAGIERQHESPGARYLRDIRASAAEINQSAEGIAADGLERLNDELADAVLGTRSLGDAFKNVANQIIGDLVRIAIQQQIVRPLAESLFGRGISGGGSGGFFSSIFGRASGGYVAPGQVVRVNEHRGGVELFRPQGGGNIVPIGQARAAPPAAAAASRPAIVQLIVDEGASFVPRVQAISGEVSVQVVRQSAKPIADMATQQTVAALGRPRL